ncbi:MAG: amidase [Acidimicrobiales bacterium]
MNADPDQLVSARKTAAAIRSREISPVEVLDACLARVDALNDQLRAVVWRDDDAARDAARQAETQVMHTAAEDLPPFCGVPVPIKDLTEVAGWPVTYGSFAAPDVVSEEGALVVEAMRRAGFVVACRTNTPEFGPITAAENLRYGISRNPWDTGRTPGGSSGGAAAATAARMFPLAHGNDGGGSIRIPASCCGLVGLKVSRGRVPSRVTSWEGGAVEGALTHDVADTAAVLDAISGPDLGCWYNAPAPERPFLQEVGADPGRLRIGVLDKPLLGLPLDPACSEAAERAASVLESLGHHVATVAFDMPEDVLAAFINVANSGLADYDGIDWERAEPHVRAGRALALGVDSLTYVRSVHDLQRFTRAVVARWADELDILVTPTMTIEPPKAGEVLAAVHASGAGPAMPVLQMAVLTSPFNVTGQPAISLPLHQGASGLPIGVQLVAGPWQEARLIRVASQLEEAMPWRDRAPAVA